MIQVRCLYCPPRCGDVALISAAWCDDDAADASVHYAHVPIVGGVAWWHWIRDAPASIAEAIKALFDDEVLSHMGNN